MLINSTPQAFRDALSRTEDWACGKAEKLRLAAAAELSAARQLLKSRFVDADLDEYQHGAAAGDSGISDDIFGEAEEAAETRPEEHSDDEDDDEEEEEVGSPEALSAAPAPAGLKGNLMAQFRRLSMQFQGDNASHAHNAASTETLSVHDRKSHADTMCLWASAAEVVPCISSNRRRPMAPEDVLLSFQSAVQAKAHSASAEEVFNVCFPLLSGDGSGDAQKPFFFGIDCRSEAEKRLGQFPKAFAMDPALLTDSEEVTKVLQVVEPMAASAHLCILGKRVKLVRWRLFQLCVSCALQALVRSTTGGSTSRALRVERSSSRGRGTLRR